MYDIVVIGAGVSGCAIARELSRYDASVLVVDREEDVCCGTSKANSAIVHAGFDAAEGSLMAQMNVRGNRMMDDLARDLDIPFKRNGAFVVCIDETQRDGLNALLARGEKNGVEGLRIVEKEELHRMEPNLSDDAVCALYAPSSGIICPFRLTIAMAECAAQNGVEFRFNIRVDALLRNAEGNWHLTTSTGPIVTRYVINAAGVYSADFHNRVSTKQLHIVPRRGDYCLLDREAGTHVSHTIFPQPTAMGKGILVTPTIHGNLMVGPTAIDIDNLEATATTAEGIDTLIAGASAYVKDLPIRKVITSFAGLRAHEDGHEFVLGEPEDAPHFIDCAGIESPGLTSAPAIGEYIGNLMKEKMSLREKSGWNGIRKDVLKPVGIDIEKRNALIKENPAYGTIICRCETISEGEIIDAIRRPLGARSLDGIKRRTRAGMGRCQAGFCSPRVMEILHRELDLPMDEITKSGRQSVMVFGQTKAGGGVIRGRIMKS